MAFASNALYALEKSGAGDRALYEETLLPLLKKKINYLHSEGVAHAIYALSNAQIWDEEAWSALKKLAVQKNFEVEYVSNSRWSIINFTKQTGGEHFFQNELTPFANQLFFQDKVNLFELYNALLQAEKQAPQLGLGETVKALEAQYGDALRNNKAFLEIDSTHH